MYVTGNPMPMYFKLSKELEDLDWKPSIYPFLDYISESTEVKVKRFVVDSEERQTELLYILLEKDDLDEIIRVDIVIATSIVLPSKNLTPSIKGKVGIFIESHYDETEYYLFNDFFVKNGYEIEYISNLWGNDHIDFSGNDHCDPVRVTKDIGSVNVDDFKSFIFIGGYAMDRLRYETKPVKGKPNSSPLGLFVQENFNNKIMGFICHSLWALTPFPQLLQGRKVTCSHNIVYDVINAGGDVQYGEDGTVNTCVDDKLVTGKHPGFTQEFLDVYLKTIESVEQ